MSEEKKINPLEKSIDELREYFGVDVEESYLGDAPCDRDGEPSPYYKRGGRKNHLKI